MHVIALKRWLVGVALAACCIPAGAIEIHGVKIAETAQVGEGGAALALNGAGIRTKFFVKVYVGALYLPGKKTTADAVLVDAGAKRMELRILHAMSAEKLGGALDEGMTANNTPDELAALNAELKVFRAFIASGGAVKEGDTIQLDYLPGTGTRIIWNGKLLGDIAGEKFSRALLKVWLGEHPVDGSLKKALLGG